MWLLIYPQKYPHSHNAYGNTSGFFKAFLPSETKRCSTFLTSSAGVSISGRMPRSNSLLLRLHY